MEEKIVQREWCTGCGVCAVVCPKNCILMESDLEGFMHPVVDKSACVCCGLCESMCPVINNMADRDEHRAYAVKNRNDDIRIDSSSGGVFPALADFVIDNGGVVCGAVYTDNFEIKHQIIDNASDICKLQGAKYSQSSVEHLFCELRRVLDDDRGVLFVGTPCQVAGLNSYLGKVYDKLILVDMICHGVPSPLVWRKYLSCRLNKDAPNSQIKSINQRDKISGWSRYRYSLHISYENSKSYCALQSQDPYMRGFVNNLFLRPSCAQCRFKGTNRCSDITLGDYWGVWEQNPELDDDKGVSLVLVNTEKGLDCLKKIHESIDLVPVNENEALKSNPSFSKSSIPHPNRSSFFERLDDVDFEKLVNESLFGESDSHCSIRNFLHRFLKR